MANIEGRPPGKIRPAELEARRAGFKGARLAMAEEIAIKTAAERCNAKTDMVTSALMILKFGTAEEIDACETGLLGTRVLYDRIRQRTTPEERQGSVRKGVATERGVRDREFDARVWAGLRDAIELITGMPAAADMVAIVKRNPSRTEFISRKMLPAQTWLEEFVNAWTE